MTTVSARTEAVRRYPGPTQLLRGIEEWVGWLAATSGSHASMVLDPMVAGSDTIRKLGDAMTLRGWDFDIRILHEPLDSSSAENLANDLSGTDLVIGVGGGSVLDHCKLAVAIDGNRVAGTMIRAHQRGSLISLPGHFVRTIPLCAVPTTLGTGSETSSVACVQHGEAKRLVMGPGLRPDCAVMHVAATDTLPHELVFEGILEVLLRTVGPYVGHRAGSPVADALAESIAAELVSMAEFSLADIEATRSVGRGTRAAIAHASAFTHTEWLANSRNPYSVRGWPIANELSTVLGIRKMTAMAMIQPTLWAHTTTGDVRIGYATRLQRIWDRMRMSAGTELASDPGTGLAELLQRWMIRADTVVDASIVDTVAERVVRHWGAGLPLLGDLRAADIRTILLECTHASTRSKPVSIDTRTPPALCTG
ncbi:hypothetical protein CH294_10840 [Rhodococcus sp. 14-2483-1-1]|uniref:daptide-type RiPP biosynthesis dehydogenase n=1 Tax=Rhodococcus sp. 14-2483-1-1 TaxID=2023148 RepID=UPI000B9BAC83|nr:daptide-type RiPP biosynthesis dehydogenase [Rhodococcus sp. 14-2483-1-1]OZF36877.1 hypothetical protein CH294_10840 [Rhodococcus sp. 14-2483-1-1]